MKSKKGVPGVLSPHQGGLSVEPGSSMARGASPQRGPQEGTSGGDPHVLTGTAASASTFYRESKGTEMAFCLLFMFYKPFLEA